MLRDLLDLLLHRWIWSGDKIRLYKRTFRVRADGRLEPLDEIIGEFRVQVCDGAVRAGDKNRQHVIRRDLPKWNKQLQCWTYHYVEGHGS